MKRILTTFSIAAALAGSLAMRASAQPVDAVEAWTRGIEKRCAAARGSDIAPPASERLEGWRQTVYESANQSVLLIDSEKTRCAPRTQLICGTGGCPIAIFGVSNGRVRLWYADQVLEWRVETGRFPRLHLRVHGSRCGGFGPTPCETVIELRSGDKRTMKPLS